MFEKKHYRLTREVTANTLADDDRPRAVNDTYLPEGTEFVVIEEKHSWPLPQDPPYYTIEVRAPGTDWREGARYTVAAADLEPAMIAAAHG